jgi:pilus assembly protein Flp/PilA
MFPGVNFFAGFGLSRRVQPNAATEEQPTGDHRKRESMSKIRKFFKSDLGATAIEYGLIAALISVVIIAALSLTGNSLTSVFNKVSTTLSSAATN